jgi:hypothetical protein
MAALAKSDSQLGDRNDNPMIGPRQDAVADVEAAGEGSANLIAAVNDILDVLRAHGLIEE